MKRRTKTIYILLFVFAIACFSLIGLYAYLNDKYQVRYVESVREHVLAVIPNCPYDKKNLVFVVIDGLRYTEAFDAQDRYLRHIWSDLAPRGTIYTNCWIDSASLTTTSHSVMISGYHQFLSNRGYIHPTFPTFIELYRDARNTWFEQEFAKIPRPSPYFPLNEENLATVQALLDDAAAFPPEKTYCLMGKERILDAVDFSSHPAYGAEFRSVIYNNMRDELVYDVFEAKLNHDKPRIIFVNLADVDEEGHSADWDRYTHSIRRADELVYQMWKDIQASPTYRDKTNFIVFSDHGRHDPEHGDFSHHGCRCEGCMHVPLLMLGPDIKAGQVIDRRTSEYDIQPTFGRMLGIETPMAVGRVLDEAFTDDASFPPPIETERTKALKEEMKTLRSDQVGEWLSWAQQNASAEKLAGLDDFSLMALMLGAAECVNLRGDEPDFLKSLVSSFENSPAIVVPAVEYMKSSGDESLTGVTRKVVEEMYDNVGKGDTNWLTLRDVAIYAPALCRAGAYFDEQKWVKAGTEILLERIKALEGSVALEGDTNEFISRFDYYAGENQMYIREMSKRDRAVFLLAHGLALENNEDAFDSEELYLLKRNLRLQMAFAAPDCREMCLYDGDSGFTYPPDIIATNYMYGTIICNQTPWIKEEFNALGYGSEINSTALEDFPAEHYFYILNLGNAFLNSGTNFDKIRVTIDWDDIFASTTDLNEPVTALGMGLFAGARWGAVKLDQYTFHLYPPEWHE
jgi:hypothetical protein